MTSARLLQWTTLWNVPGLQVSVEYSARLRSTLGLTYLERNLIRLHRELPSHWPELVDEVLCHELAHLAARRLHGAGIRPHGPEWRELVEMAGFPARRGIRTPGEARTTTRMFVHRCPVCQTRRLARRKMGRWRCAECVAQGLEGRLLIE